MVVFSDNIKACLALDNVEAFYLLRITNSDNSVIYASTTYFKDIVLSNGYSYTADDLILAVDSPQISSSVDREQYKIVLADPTFAQGVSASTGLVGKHLETRIGFINRSATPGVTTFVVGSSYNFNGNTLPLSWSYPGTITSTDTATTTTLTNTVIDQNLRLSNISINPVSNYIIRMRVKLVSGAWEGVLFYTNTNHGVSGAVGQYISIPAPTLGVWTTIDVDVRTLINDYLTGGTLTALRFDLINASSASVAIDYIQFGKAEDYGQPYLNSSDTFIVYKGRVESVSYAIDTQEIGEAKINITGSSPIVNLDQKNSIYLSRDYIRKQNASDSCCDQIFEGSGTLSLKWGKK
jgi:hypothetical protein